MMPLFDRASSSFALFLLWTIATARLVAGAAEHADYETYVCENETGEISCPDGLFIHLLVANYGRFSVQTCNKRGVNYPNTMCSNEKTMEKLMEICDGKTKCTLTANNAFFGDTCPEVTKYLQVEHSCSKFPPATTTTNLPPSSTPTTTIAQSTPSVTRTSTVAPGNGDKEAIDATDPTTTAALFCAETTARGVRWPKTYTGKPAKTACPNGPDGAYAKWHCAANGVWGPDNPDLSLCVSEWARDLKARSLRYSSEAKPLDLVRQVERDTAIQEAVGGDTVVVVDVLNTLVGNFAEMIQPMATDDCRHYATRMGELMVESANNVLNTQARQSWDDLPMGTKISTAAKLVDAVERTAIMVANAYSVNGPTPPPFPKTSNVFLQVAVASVHDYVKFPSYSLHDPSIDSVLIPYEALTATRLNATKPSHAKVVFASYRQVGEFLSPEPRVDTNSMGEEVSTERKVVSRIITATVVDGSAVRNLHSPVVLTFSTQKNENLTNPTCVWWDRSMKPNGAWSGIGCRVQSHNDTHTVCACDHLTNFAVLMDVRGLELDDGHAVALTFITYAGCIISIVCLFISFCAFQFLRGIGGERITIHKNLCFCLFVAELIFIFGIWQTQHILACSIIAGCLQYFFLAAFAWMLLEGFELYYMLVEVFESSHSRKPYFYLFGYGMPAVIVGISVWVDRFSYGTERYCWLRTDNYFVLSFVGPVVVVLVANTMFLIMTLVIVCRHSNIGYSPCKHDPGTMKNVRSWLKGAIVLVFLLGLTWTFGLLWVDRESVLMAYIFTVLNSLQGLFIFLFHVAFNDRVRKEYRKWVHRSHWLPSCMRSYALNRRTDGRDGYIAGVRPNGSSSSTNEGASSPSPPTSGTSTSHTLLRDKFYPQSDIMRSTDPRYNSSVQLLLARQDATNNGPYDYATICYGSAGLPFAYPIKGGVAPSAPAFEQYEERRLPLPHMPFRPPPNFPPPAPPGKISPRPISGQSAKLSDDSAYSEGSGSSMLFAAQPHDFIRMDLSQNPPVFCFPNTYEVPRAGGHGRGHL